MFITGTMQNGIVLGKRKTEIQEENDDELNIKKGKKHKKTKTAEMENELNNNEVLSLNGEEQEATIKDKSHKRKNSKKTSTRESNKQQINGDAAEITNENVQDNTIKEQVIDGSNRKKHKLRKSGPLTEQQNTAIDMKEEGVTLKRKKKKSKSAGNQSENIPFNGEAETVNVNKSLTNGAETEKQKTKTDDSKNEQLLMHKELSDKAVNNEEDTNKATPKKMKKKRKTTESNMQNGDTELLVANYDSIEKDEINSASNQDHSNANVVNEDKLDKTLKEMREKIANTVSTPQAKSTTQRNAKSMTPHAFATFTKMKTPVAYVKKPKPQTEPRKMSEKQVFVYT